MFNEVIIHFYFQWTWMTMNNISTSGGLTFYLCLFSLFQISENSLLDRSQVSHQTGLLLILISRFLC